jgi:uncharacterized membrane protein YeiB
MGLLLYPWWPGDILHFYGGYMHFAAFLLFVPKRFYWWVALAAMLIFHILTLIIPIETSWDFDKFQYLDFWTWEGFLRNTFYNGWNSIFPWLAFFMAGMWLGRLDWSKPKVKQNVFFIGLFLFILVEILRFWIKYDWNNPDWHNFYEKYWVYITSEYFPAYPAFMLVTGGFALMVISICMWIGERFSNTLIIQSLVKTGQMTLTHYIIHLTLGIILLAALTGKTYSGFTEDETPTTPTYIFTYACLFFALSVTFSIFWRKRFEKGPMEMLMRNYERWFFKKR